MASSGNDFPNSDERSLFHRIFLGNLVLLIVACLAYYAPSGMAQMLIMVLGIPLAFLLARSISAPFRHGIEMLNTALHTVSDGDYSMRLAPPAQSELAAITNFYNQIAEQFMEERKGIYQKELLLDTVVQSAPMGILLVGPSGHLVLANVTAREMILPGQPILGLSLEQLSDQAPEAMREILTAGRDALFSLPVDDELETYHLSQRHFSLNAMDHRLILIKRLTRELHRQEVEIWKKLIRLINHELNNTLAPIRSLLHSARTLAGRENSEEKLNRVFDTMDQATLHLQRFLEDYATFARLPKPRLQEIPLRPWLENLQELTSFQLAGDNLPQIARFDPDQMQHVLHNLVKNAHEASDEGAAVVVAVNPIQDGGLRLEVRDRGRGMSDEAFAKALLPFYSTKKQGTGLGLSLAREIVESHGGVMRIQRRKQGGIAIIVRLPDAVVSAN